MQNPRKDEEPTPPRRSSSSSTSTEPKVMILESIIVSSANNPYAPGPSSLISPVRSNIQRLRLSPSPSYTMGNYYVQPTQTEILEALATDRQETATPWIVSTSNYVDPSRVSSQRTPIKNPPSPSTMWIPTTFPCTPPKQLSPRKAQTNPPPAHYQPIPKFGSPPRPSQIQVIPPGSGYVSPSVPLQLNAASSNIPRIHITPPSSARQSPQKRSSPSPTTREVYLQMLPPMTPTKRSPKKQKSLSPSVLNYSPSPPAKFPTLKIHQPGDQPIPSTLEGDPPSMDTLTKMHEASMLSGMELLERYESLIQASSAKMQPPPPYPYPAGIPSTSGPSYATPSQTIQSSASMSQPGCSWMNQSTMEAKPGPSREPQIPSTSSTSAGPSNVQVYIPSPSTSSGPNFAAQCVAPAPNFLIGGRVTTGLEMIARRPKPNTPVDDTPSRYTLDEEDIDALEEIFEINRYPSELACYYLSKEMHKDEESINIWFQNRNVRREIDEEEAYLQEMQRKLEQEKKDEEGLG